uniref:Uncharacterized protein n=1 Tax=Panagrolaimus sp. ES5 TaxID=591445 RepID=A0AC34F0H7_9BILA
MHLSTAKQIPSTSSESGNSEKISPTLEQLLSLHRQMHDPPSYYQELSLNEGPVDKVPRLCNVSSQYAIDDLQIFSAMDTPEQQYKLKSLAQHEFDLYNCLPAETAHGIDHSQICYEDGEVYFCDY